MKNFFISALIFISTAGYTFANSTDLLNKIQWTDRTWLQEININSDVPGFTLQIADSLISLFMLLSLVYFFIIFIKLIMNPDAEDEKWNFKKWFIWISIWIMVMQMAKVYVRSFTTHEDLVKASSTNIPEFWHMILDQVVKPLTALLETWASFVFLLMWIYAFFKLITSNWDEDKATEWKNIIFYSIAWFIIIKISSVLVKAVYWECKLQEITKILTTTCQYSKNISEASNIFTTIINWINSFVWVWIVIMVIYTWFKIIFSNWDEDKLNDWKKSLIYITIWIWILVMNYLILTFFLNKDFLTTINI